MKRHTLAQLQRKCDEFNARFPVGSEVLLDMDSGEQRQTRTRSPAQVLSGHTPVVWLEGVSGCYHIDRVRMIAVPAGGAQ